MVGDVHTECVEKPHGFLKKDHAPLKQPFYSFFGYVAKVCVILRWDSSVGIVTRLRGSIPGRCKMYRSAVGRTQPSIQRVPVPLYRGG